MAAFYASRSMNGDRKVRSEDNYQSPAKRKNNFEGSCDSTCRIFTGQNNYKGNITEEK